MKEVLKRVGVVAVLAVIAMLLSVPSVLAAPPFDRTFTWTNPTTYLDNTPITGDLLKTHVYYCPSQTDTSTCIEVVVSAAGATTASATVTQQKRGETAYYRLKSESTLYSTTSGFSGAASFFLPAPVPSPGSGLTVQ